MLAIMMIVKMYIVKHRTHIILLLGTFVAEWLPSRNTIVVGSVSLGAAVPPVSDMTDKTDLTDIDPGCF